MKKESLFDKILNNKKYLMLTSLVLAFLFWFLVVATISPDSTRTVYGVPITVNEDDGFLSTAGLHVIEESSAKISVDVTGPRYIIGKLTASELTVTPDVSKVTKSGKYTLSLNASMKQPNPKVSIAKVHPSTVQMKFDKLVSKNVTVDVKLSNSKVADGYILESATANPKQVVITGPADEVSQVTRAVANITVDNTANSTVVSKTTVKLYDSKGNQLDLKNIRTENLNVTVTVPILKLKTQVPLTVDFTNIPSGFDKNNIKYTINPSSISIAGEEKLVNAVSNIKLDSIDFNSLDITNTVTSNINIPTSVTSVDNDSTATVSITLQNTATKVINTNDIKITNIPKGYSARVRTSTLNNIKLFGPASDIGSVNSVTATVDMSAINVIEGTYEAPVTITVPGKSGYWVTSKYYVTINSWKN